MKYYVQFLTLNSKNKIVRALGSDEIFILDERNNVNTMLEDAHKRMY